MADPLNPRLDNEALIERLREQCPSLSRNDIIWFAELFGFDLEPPPSGGDAPT